MARRRATAPICFMTAVDAAGGGRGRHRQPHEKRFAQHASATSSPYYAAWVAGQPLDLAAARAAIRARDFAALAEVAEHNCLKMHAAALAAQPPLVYWNGATVECLHAVRRLRAGGVPVPRSTPARVKATRRALADVDGRRTRCRGLELMTSALGPGAELC
jgi:hypothetical protein